MAFKFVAALCFIASVSAGTLDHLTYQQPAILKVQQQQPIQVIKQVDAGLAYSNGHDDGEQYGPAHYAFDYSVHDEHTGDIKEQKEQRDGDRVEGYYSLVEPDGHKRIVHYQSDKHSGFNAQVSREYVGIQAPQQVQKVIAAPVAIKKIVSAPVLTKIVSAPAYDNYNGGVSGGYYAQDNSGANYGGLNNYH